MSITNKKIKSISVLTAWLFGLFFWGCATGIQNIRQVDSSSVSIETGKLTVMTFNIHVGGGSAYPLMNPYEVKATKENLTKVAEAIKSVDPDIIGLQEVRGFQQAKFIAKQLNLNYAYVPHRSGWWGLAILSKYKISDLISKPISTTGGMGTAQICTVQIEGKPVIFINLHVSPSHLAMADSSYEEQFDAIMKILANIEGPIILTGDLNRKPWTEEINLIKKKLVDTAEASGATNVFTHGKLPVRIDYIFFDPKYFVVIDADVVSEAHWDASDHLAYWARIKLKK
jgi:endonuclease/exonuclease/phosphatase family metal-dependent hydrolase